VVDFRIGDGQSRHEAQRVRARGVDQQTTLSRQLDHLRRAIESESEGTEQTSATHRATAVSARQGIPGLKDFLYLMDFWLGMEWAWENIEYKTQQELVA
jgi:hypothetical protein